MTDTSFASFELPPAIIRWTTMLRTTQIPQGFGVMRRRTLPQDCYCALGIFLLANEKYVGYLGDEKNTDSVNYLVEVLGRSGRNAVIMKNDDEKQSFRHIANWAERYFSKYGPHVDRARAALSASHPAQTGEDPMQVIPNYVVGGDGGPVEDPKTPPPAEPVPTPPAEPEEIYDEDDDLDLEDDEDEEDDE